MSSKVKEVCSKILFTYIRDFLIAGPFLFGWIIGILHYPKNSPQFLAAVQNFFISAIFMCLYGLFFVLELMLQVIGENPLLYIESFLSLFYLIITLAKYFFYLKRQPAPGDKFTQSLLDRLFPDETKSEPGAHSSVG